MKVALLSAPHPPKSSQLAGTHCEDIQFRPPLPSSAQNMGPAPLIQTQTCWLRGSSLAPVCVSAVEPVKKSDCVCMTLNQISHNTRETGTGSWVLEKTICSRFCRGKYRSKPACPAVGRVKSGVVGVDGGRLPLRLCCVADSDSVLDGAILCASEGRGCEE